MNGLAFISTDGGCEDPAHAFSLLERRQISSSNDTHEVVKPQPGMLCKVSGESDRKTHSLLLFFELSVDLCCGVVRFLSCAVTLHNTHCWMLLHWLKK